MGEWERATTELGERLTRVFDQLAERLTVHAAAGSLDRRPRADAWCARQIAEHVTLTDRYLLILADKIARKSERRLARGAAVPEAPPDTEHLERLARRSFRWSHPEHMSPTGEVGVDELTQQLSHDRERAGELLARMPAGQGSLHRIRMSVVGEGDRLDLYQYLTIVALHAERHLAQMERAASGDTV